MRNTPWALVVIAAGLLAVTPAMAMVGLPDIAHEDSLMGGAVGTTASIVFKARANCDEHFGYNGQGYGAGWEADIYYTLPLPVPYLLRSSDNGDEVIEEVRTGPDVLWMHALMWWPYSTPVHGAYEFRGEIVRLDDPTDHAVVEGSIPVPC